MHQIFTKHIQIPWLAKFWLSVNPVLIADTRGRPACWLFWASCVSMICFWYPHILIAESHDSLFARIATGETLLYFPLAAFASIVALLNYIVLWRRARRSRGVASRWLLSIGSLMVLIGLAPGLLFVTILIVAVIATLQH